MREKLVELLDDIQRCGEGYTDYEIYGMRLPDTVSNEDVADHLIANGVTVQEWISVKDQEEPTENGTYLCHGYWFGSKRKQTETAEFFGEWNIENNFILTHWMEIPEPTKEVDND